MYRLISVLILLTCGTASIAAYAPLDFDLPGGKLSLPGGEAPIFDLCTTLDAKDPQARSVTDKDFRQVDETTEGSKRVVAFSKPPEGWGTDTRVKVTYENVGREVLTKITIESAGDSQIRLIRFPVMDTPQVKRYDTLLFPLHTGDAIHDPRVMISTRLGGIYSRRYPADCGLQYMVLYNDALTHYLAAYYDGDEFYDWTVRSAPKDRLRFSLDWYPFLDKGGKWESPTCSMTVLPGDWHGAADLYREHMTAVMRPPALPKWLREDFHGWIQLSMKAGDPKPSHKYTDLVRVYKETVEANGLNTLHVFSWQQGGFHHFPDFVAAPACGTPEELRAAMDEIKARGGHVDLYTHGSLIDSDSDLYRAEGDYSWAKQENGGGYIGKPESDRTPMGRACPYSKSFQDHFAKQFERMIVEYHAHGAQIDTNACIPAQFCFDKRHGHRTPASGWLPGEDALLGKVHETYRKLDPDFFVWVEGINERYGRYYEINQGHGENQSWSAGEGFPEQFQYTFPDYLCTGGSDSFDGLCHTFGQGKPFDIHPGPRLSDPTYTGLLRDFVKVRKSEPDYFLRGRFMDNVGLTFTGRDYKVWRIDRRDGGGMLINFWGRGRTVNDECECSIRTPKGMKRVGAVYPTGLKIVTDGSWHTLSWTGPVATVVFEPSAEF